MKILLLTATFPPQGGSGVQRPYYQFKHLSEFGHDVWVVGASDSGWVSDDTFPLSHKEEERVLRVPLYKSKLEQRICTRLSKWTGCVPFPDRAAGWARRAFQASRRLIEKHAIDVIITSVGYGSMLSLGAKLQAITNGTLVVDFRDLLTSNPVYFEGNPYKHPLIRSIHASAEDRWMKRASAACAVSPHHAAIIWLRNPHLSAVRVIQNGFGDSSTGRRVFAPNDKFTFRYTGFVHPSMRLDAFFEALARLQSRVPSVANELVVEFYCGNPQFVSNLVESFGVGSLVEVNGYVPYGRVVELQKSADALLLMWTPDPGCMCGKMYEYLAAGPPILAVSQGNVDGKFVVESTNRGLCCDAAEIESLRDSILKFARTDHACSFEEANIERYSRKNQNRLLSDLLIDLQDAGSGG